jgi:UDP-glucuronate decarboxylase
MKILITGGAGFLGEHLCRRLLSEGHYVICLDSLQTSNKSKIQDLLFNDNFKFIDDDIRFCDDALIGEYDRFMYFNKDTKEYEPLDQIYNLACPASPEKYQQDSIKTLETSFVGAANLLELASSMNARILQASTSEVYGDPDCNEQTEEYWGSVNCIGPRSCYDEGKRVAESLFMSYHLQRNVDIRIVRIFNTYGPGMHPKDGRVISNFIDQALNDKDLTIYGSGLQNRSFCYVDDLIDGLVKMMNQSETIGPINLGNPKEQYTIKDVASFIIKLTGSESSLTFKELPGDDPKKRKPVIKKAKKYLNWEPKTDLITGLQKTIENFKN